MARHKPYRPPTSITLAGIPVRRELVEWIAAEVPDDPAGDRLRRALDNDTRILGLENEDRERLLRALEDCPDGLGELRSALLQEHVARIRGEMA
jgi:hypothetical protein